MTKFLKNHWPLIISIAVLWSVTAVLYFQILDINNGVFLYSLDDPYIHMSMARNLAEHGVWGISPSGFTSSSSSPLWVLILSGAFKLFGVHELIPLFVNIAFATFLLIAVNHVCKSLFFSTYLRFVTLIAVLFFPPLPALIFVGMEHILFGLLAFVFFFILASIQRQETPKWECGQYLLITLAPFLSFTRYEGFALLVAAVLILFAKKRFLSGITTAISGSLPAVIFGIISVSQGWFFVPNSILVKSKTSILSRIFNTTEMAADQAILTILLYFHVAVFISVIVLVIWYLHKSKIATNEIKNLIIVFVVLFLIQNIFSRPIPFQFMRYEAYLFPIGILLLSWFFSLEHKNLILTRNKLIFITIGTSTLLFVTTMIVYSHNLINGTLDYSHAIYSQQNQMTRFISRYYNNASIAANDIGMLSYYTNVKIYDVAGLANMEVARDILNNNETLLGERVKEQNDIAIVYDSWRNPETLKKWFFVGKWSVSDLGGVAGIKPLGDDDVSFYATNEHGFELLHKHLDEFEDFLPDNVEQTLAEMSQTKIPLQKTRF